MGISNKIIQFLLSIFIIVGFIGLVWYIFNRIWSLFSNLNDGVLAAIVTAITTFLVTFISIISAKYYERKLLIEKEMRDKKIPAYNEFIEFIFKILDQENKKKKITEQEMTQFFSTFTRQILVWGSDEVIAQWSSYRRSALSEVSDGASNNSMFELEKLLIAIRKDTGHKNSNIKKGDLLRLFINDIDNYIEE
ncbi:hypothetical protein DVB69_00175 [Sporosarcina sp. BI001-red]|uniref:hypothetical protein n=1 Tax=Sporosarcina sp. BI001-red TaxID=2282866 RepID=UPI000E2394DF|nr:hypothetical protein [Sporosarcina sp. BI001-red]REB11597.1 hypothetical protein DVB69_00175 [Sporosarcina sp. BI001-red]